MPKIQIGSFSLNVPEDYGVMSFMMASQPKTSGEMHYATTIVCACEPVPESVTVAQYVLVLTDKLRKAPVPARRGDKLPRRFNLVNGEEAMVIEQSMQDPQGTVIEQLVMVTIQNNVAYVVTASCPGGEPFTENRASLEQVLSSFAVAPRMLQ